MEAWYETASLSKEAEDHFHERWMLVGGPKGAAVFAVYDPDTKGMHCYINPAMAMLFPDLLEASQAVSCTPLSKPYPPLLFGDQQILE